MARKSIERQLAELKFDAKIYAANQRRLVHDNTPILQHLTQAEFATLYHVSSGFEMLGLSIDDGIGLGIRNRLPQALQSHYNAMPTNEVSNKTKSEMEISIKTQMESETEAKLAIETHPYARSLDERYPRWRSDVWRCSCGEHKTLWYKTRFSFKDHNQIYCAACRTLSGWGTDLAFKAAHVKGEATRIVITHPLDSDAFTPPLITRLPNTPSQNPIHGKQSQKRTPSQSPIRAKRSQGSVCAAKSTSKSEIATCTKTLARGKT